MYTMLTQIQAQQLAFNHKTIVDNVLKEHYQMYILDLLYKSSFSDKLVFKGGTALRLAYNSVRFSEDLDFSLTRNVNFGDFEKTIKTIVAKFSESKLSDIYDKRNTLYAKIVFRVDYKPIPIGIKIEVNKKEKGFEKTIGILKSPFNNVEVMAGVYTIESILKDKLKIIKTGIRRQTRDLFDAWYISQKIDVPFEIKESFKYSKKELMDSLNSLLPENSRKVIDLFRNEN